MLIKLFAAGLVLFSGTGLATEGNIRPEGQVEIVAQAPEGEVDGEKGTRQLNTWVVIEESGRYGASIPGNVYVERIDFSHSGTYQDLKASVYIPQCTGEAGPCQRSFSFNLQCRDDWGTTWVVQSPFFRNYATSGYEYRNYSFNHQNLYYCANIDNIWMSYRHGW